MAPSRTKAFITKLDQKTLDRIEMIEKLPIGLEEAMDKIQSIMNRDLPKDQRPGDSFFYYVYKGGKYVISSWSKEKVIKSIVDNKTIHEGKIVPLHADV